MKIPIMSMIVVSGLMISGTVKAVDMPDIAKKSGCTVCHAIDRKVFGPAWMDVANRYKGVTKYKYSKNGASAPDAKEYPLVEGLMMKVSLGGHGNWGKAAMIANDPSGSEQPAIKELVTFILNLAK